MKKILCGMICVAAGASLASIETTVATVDVIAVDSRLTNTVIAVPGLDLATGGDLAISNLVKTSNLTPDDRMLAFSNGTYDSWKLSDAKVWVKPTEKFSVDSFGDVQAGNTVEAALVTKAVGSGIWISRQNVSTPIYVYAQHANTLTSKVSAKKTALLGNPSPSGKTPVISGCANGDKIIVPTAGLPKTYTYSSTDGKWYGYIGVTKTEGLPPIAAGTGFWYVSKGESEVSVAW